MPHNAQLQSHFIVFTILEDVASFRQSQGFLWLLLLSSLSCFVLLLVLFFQRRFLDVTLADLELTL